MGYNVNYKGVIVLTPKLNKEQEEKLRAIMGDDDSDVGYFLRYDPNNCHLLPTNDEKCYVEDMKKCIDILVKTFFVPSGKVLTIRCFDT
jgi:hypothetical protein